MKRIKIGRFSCSLEIREKTEKNKIAIPHTHNKNTRLIVQINPLKSRRLMSACTNNTMTSKALTIIITHDIKQLRKPLFYFRRPILLDL